MADAREASKDTVDVAGTARKADDIVLRHTTMCVKEDMVISTRHTHRNIVPHSTSSKRILASILKNNGVIHGGICFYAGACTAMAFVTLWADGEKGTAFKTLSRELFTTEVGSWTAEIRDPMARDCRKPRKRWPPEPRA